MSLDKEQAELKKEYFQLARKLGKLPTLRETKKFICSHDKIARLFESFNSLRQETIAKYPELEEFIMPATLTNADIESYKLNLEKNKRKQQNHKFLNLSTSMDYIKRLSEDVFKGNVTPVSPKSQKSKINRSLILTLSDLHFGADIKSEETGHLSYGPVEEARRFAEVIRQTIDYKPQYRKETELHVNLLGDIIQHKLHDPQDAAPVSEQVCRSIHLLIQGLAHLGESFGKVTVHCATGNHGRDLNRHQSRATSGKWDSVETVIYFAVKSALSKYKNITVDIPKTPYCIYEVLGHKVMATHGDNVINPGNPGKAINVGKLEQQINRLNASLKDQEEIKLIFVGHVHVASVTSLNCGSNLITNGALPPVDQFAVSIGILEGQSSQTLVECTAEYSLGDIRFIKVGAKQDNDKELDKVIKRWEAF